MTTARKTQYFEGIGRRKNAVARVRVVPQGKGGFIINEKKLDDFFPIREHQLIANQALEKTALSGKASVSVKVSGGGVSAQAEAVRLGAARALVKYNEELRGELKKAGYLKRDPRIVERKKFGLKKARRAPQWSKR